MKKVLITIVLCIVFGVIGYFGTLKLDELRKDGDVSLNVVFEDNKEYEIPSIKVMKKEEALKEWPYIIHLDNKGKGTGLYQIILSEQENSIQRDNLDYVLLCDDKEVASGHLNEIKNNVLYQGEIKGETKKDYKLYIWVIKEVEENSKFVYQLEFNTIKAGGPGF